MVFLLMLNCRSKLKGSAILLGDSAKQQSLFTVAESSILKQHRLDCVAVSIILKQHEFNAFLCNSILNIQSLNNCIFITAIECQDKCCLGFITGTIGHIFVSPGGSQEATKAMS